MKYIIGNWKANKNIDSAQMWFKTFLSFELDKLNKDIQIIICPPFHLLLEAKKFTHDIPFISIGAQNLSSFDDGPYTGEITAESLKDLVSYVIIGHSERRKYFFEDNSDLEKRIINAQKNNISPIFCISDQADMLLTKSKIIAFEPPDAISKGDGHGNTASLESVIGFKKNLNLDSSQKFIYGGSINADNAAEFINNDEIDGVLPGGASLDPKAFYAICLSYQL